MEKIGGSKRWRKGGELDSFVCHSYGFGLWKAIRIGWDSFNRFVGIDGRQIRFWQSGCVLI
jgi:hypothetical protein